MDFSRCIHSLEKAKLWSVKCLEETVICESLSEFEVSNSNFSSPIFWHSGSTQWRMEIKVYWDSLSVSFNLLSSQRDPSEKADLKVSLVEGDEITDNQSMKNVNLNSPKTIHMTFPLTENCWYRIRGEVNIPADDKICGAVSDTFEPSEAPRGPCSLPDDLEALLTSGDLSDIMLHAGGVELRAHKALLAARSEVFSAMFRHDSQEAHTGKVHIEDVGPDILQELLHYMYTGRSPGVNQVADQLLVAADKYGVTGLKKLCEEELVNNLTIENAAATGVIAFTHSCDVLKQSAITFIKKYLVRVLATEGWAVATRKHTEVTLEIFRLMANESGT